MKAFLISDNHDTLVLMRLAGVAGMVVHGCDETQAAIEKALQRDDLGVLVITERAAACIPNEMTELRKHDALPLVVEIPDRHGSMRGDDFLSRYVREAIGVKVE